MCNFYGGGEDSGKRSLATIFTVVFGVGRSANSNVFDDFAWVNEYGWGPAVELAVSVELAVELAVSVAEPVVELAEELAVDGGGAAEGGTCV